jgi:hypothetical protein
MSSWNSVSNDNLKGGLLTMRKIHVDSCLLKKAWQNHNMNMNTDINMGKDMNMDMDMDMDIDTNMDRDNFNKYNTYKCIKNIIILQSKHV